MAHQIPQAGAQLKEIVEESTRLRRGFQTDGSELRRSIDEARVKVREAQATLEQAVTAENSHRRQEAQRERELLLLEDKIKSAQELIAVEADGQLARLAKSERMRAMIEDELRAARLANRELENGRDMLVAEIEALKEELEKQAGENRGLKAKLREAAEHIRGAMNALRQDRERIRALTAEKAAATQANEDLSRRLTQAAAKITSLEGERATLAKNSADKTANVAADLMGAIGKLLDKDADKARERQEQEYLKKISRELDIDYHFRNGGSFSEER